MSSPPSQETTVEDLPFFSAQVGETTLGADVARLFEHDRTLPGVIVVGERGLRGMVARNQFFQRLGRLFGIEVYSTRPITAYLDSLPIQPLVIPARTTIQNAAIVCLARPDENVYDPFVVLPPEGPPRLVDFLALILKQTELLAEARIEAQAQKSAAMAASNAKSEFLANMSHELRTPLTAIIGYGEILIEDASAGQYSEMLPRLQSVVSAGLHLLGMINDILDLTKIEARKTDLFPETFALSPFLHEITGIVTPLMQKNRNEFSLLCDGELGEIHSDEMKIKQCLLNLLSNASKFTHQGRILLRVYKDGDPDGDWAVFAVSDTGIGMTQDQMRRLFEPFYQADSSISRRYGGTGLGLSLTKQFCQLLGGSLSVESELDKGTTFTMKLPYRSKEPGDTSGS
jgi:signal transduction histidine kinase